MSWDGYITNLKATKMVAEAAIIGHDGNVWAASDGLKIPATEGASLSKGFVNAGSPLLATGIKLNGVKYFALKITETEILAKKGNTGIAAYKTKQAIVIGLYPENVQPGQCTIEVGKIADYLKEAGY